MRDTVDPVLFSEFAKEIRNLSPTGPTERELQNFLLAPVIRLKKPVTKKPVTGRDVHPNPSRVSSGIVPSGPPGFPHGGTSPVSKY
jgi:hypothetical protein